MRKIAAAAIALVAAVALLGSALVLTGTVTLVTTHGISMQPRLQAGDLVAVTPRASYSVGDAVAYRSDELQTTVLHRIVAIENGRYTFQGDNNDWLDPEHPTKDMLIGTEVLHIPGGGLWLDRLTSPVALGLGTLLVLVTGGSAAQSRRARRRRRSVSQHAARPTGRGPSAALPPWAFTTAAVAALVGALGAVLGFAAWTTSASPVTGATAAPGQQMTFSYTATVPESAAYDGTTVRAPQPVFRKLTDTVEVSYAYAGAPGKVVVNAELSSTSGWTSTVPLQTLRRFDHGQYSGRVTLDLDALEKRAWDAAQAIGIPAGDIGLTIAPDVTTADGSFRPRLPLTLSDLKLSLAGDKSALVVGDDGRTGTTATNSAVTPALSLLGRELPVPAARWLSVALVAGALLAVVAVGVTAWVLRPATEGAAIRVRHANRLVEVQPIAAPEGRSIVDVTDFATLAKLADRYDLLILHWARGGTETFVVQDLDCFYRYRAGAEPRSAQADVRMEQSV